MSSDNQDYEIWKIHPDYSCWEISNFGRIRNAKTKLLYELKKPKNSNYYVIYYKYDHKIKAIPLHRIVAELFIGPVYNPSITIDHINGNPRDNRACNLEYVSRRENSRRQLKMWSNPNNFYNRELLKVHCEKRWEYQETLYTWIELLKLLHNEGIYYYQIKWISNKELGDRVGLLPTGEIISKIKVKGEKEI